MLLRDYKNHETVRNWIICSARRSLSSIHYLAGTYALKLEAVLRCLCKELEQTVLPLTRLQFYNHAEWVQCHCVWPKSPNIVERHNNECISEHFSTVSLLWTFWTAFKGLWRWISTAVLSVSAFPTVLLFACSSFCMLPLSSRAATFPHISSLCPIRALQPFSITVSSVFFCSLYQTHLIFWKAYFLPFIELSSGG